MHVPLGQDWCRSLHQCHYHRIEVATASVNRSHCTGLGGHTNTNSPTVTTSCINTLAKTIVRTAQLKYYTIADVPVTWALGNRHCSTMFLSPTWKTSRGVLRILQRRVCMVGHRGFVCHLTFINCLECRSLWLCFRRWTKNPVGINDSVWICSCMWSKCNYPSS